MTQTNLEGRSVVLVHPTGNQFVRHAAQALQEAGALGGFHTTVAWKPGSPLNRFLPGKLRAELSRRAYPSIPDNLIHPHPIRELFRLVAERGGWKSLTKLETGIFCFDEVCAGLDRTAGRALKRDPHRDAVYAYEDCATESFAAAAQFGIRRIYDLPIGYYRAWAGLAREERELSPEWSETVTGIHNSPAKLARKDRELAQADAIFVASSFTAASLKAYPEPLAARIFTIPYGAPPVGPMREPTRRDAPLRILYAGLLTQRKGIGYLMDAVNQLKVPFTLTLLGNPVARPPAMQRALSTHRWIPTAPHHEVLRLMREHDVLVFPSLFEGFGLVILEAMAQGTVVIATPNTAAPDLYKDGDGGFIVPIRSADAIAARLTQLAEDRGLLAQMSERAQAIAAECTWDRYREGLLAAIRDSLAST